MLSGYFYDNAEEPDEVVAAQAIAPGLHAPGLRAKRLISDSERLLQNMDHEWEIFSKVANRYLDNANEARTWLLKILTVWEKALRDTEGGKLS